MSILTALLMGGDCNDAVAEIYQVQQSFSPICTDLDDDGLSDCSLSGAGIITAVILVRASLTIWVLILCRSLIK